MMEFGEWSTVVFLSWKFGLYFRYRVYMRVTERFIDELYGFVFE